MAKSKKEKVTPAKGEQAENLKETQQKVEKNQQKKVKQENEENTAKQPLVLVPFDKSKFSEEEFNRCLSLCQKNYSTRIEVGLGEGLVDAVEDALKFTEDADNFDENEKITLLMPNVYIIAAHPEIGEKFYRQQFEEKASLMVPVLISLDTLKFFVQVAKTYGRPFEDCIPFNEDSVVLDWQKDDVLLTFATKSPDDKLVRGLLPRKKFLANYPEGRSEYLLNLLDEFIGVK